MADLTLSLSDGAGVALAAPVPVETPGVIVALLGQAEGGAPRVKIEVMADATLPVILFMLSDATGGAYDLATATTTFRMRLRDAAQGDYTIDAACTYITTGLVAYQLMTADVDVAGEFWGELRMDFGGGQVYTTERFVVRVREGLV